MRTVETRQSLVLGCIKSDQYWPERNIMEMIWPGLSIRGLVQQIDRLPDRKNGQLLTPSTESLSNNVLNALAWLLCPTGIPLLEVAKSASWRGSQQSLS